MPLTLEDLQALVNQKIETLRPKLLDLSRRNPLIATKLSPRSNSHIRVVDELPDVLFYNLGNGQEMRFIPLPPIDDDPKDEEADRFQRALANGRITDEIYQAAAESIDGSADDYLDQSRRIERALKDRIREQLGMPPRPSKAEVNIVQHARNNGVTPSYDLPLPTTEQDDRHRDADIQTLQLPKDLERKLGGLTSKGNTWMQETGLNVLHAAFGFLEWAEPGSTETSFAPLILIQIKIEKRKSREGTFFWASGSGEDPEVNAVLAEKLRLEFGVQLPAFTGGSIEAFLEEVGRLSPPAVTWRVRRQVVFGVFPSARMAMYHDLNTQTARFGDNAIIKPLFAGSGGTGEATPFADEYQVDEPAIERKVPCLVLDADSSQFSTLVDVADGKNVAVEGPPGTGKSQTIVNAIAAAMSEGKKVLFVAQKTAALNVVKARLEAIGLGDFILPLQAERSTRENVMESIRQRLEMSTELAPRDYEDQVAELRKVRDEIQSYLSIIGKPFETSGLTLHEILGSSIATDARLRALPRDLQLASFPLGALERGSIADLRRKAETIERASVKAKGVASTGGAQKLCI